MDYSLKFFSRTTHLSQSEELFINKYSNRPLANRNYKLEAIGLLTYLQMLLLQDPDTGFYYDVSGNRFQLLANKMGISNKALKQTLDCCFEYNLLDGNMYQKYGILTSIKMQNDYAQPLTLKRRGQNINMDYVYKGCSFTIDFEIALQNYKNALQNRKNAKQNSGDKTKQNDIEIKTNIEKNSNLVEEFNVALSQFKNNFPNKKCDADIEFKPDIDFTLLEKNIKASPFLMKCNNLNWKWCIEHYKEITSGQYAEWKKDTAAPNHKGRDYTAMGIDLKEIVYDDINEVLKEFENGEL